MLEIYLKENDSNMIRFPVTPSEVSCETSANISTESVNDLGNASLFSGVELRSIPINSFFPNRQYSFCTYSNVEPPYEFVSKIEKWQNEGKKLRYIVSDGYTNVPVMINSFSYREQDGTGDVYFDLSLIEYKEIKLNKTTSSSSNNSSNNSTDRTTENAPKPSGENKSHKVVSGDSLWAIAQKYYGDGSQYPKIKEANKDKYTSLKNNNIIYSNWELVIP
jgi:LysM repeat protein